MAERERERERERQTERGGERDVGVLPNIPDQTKETRLRDRSSEEAARQRACCDSGGFPVAWEPKWLSIRLSYPAGNSIPPVGGPLTLRTARLLLITSEQRCAKADVLDV